jgi:hypothetical protein
MLRPLTVLASCLIASTSPAALVGQAEPLRLALVQDEEASNSPDIRLVTPDDGYLLLVHVVGGRVGILYPGKPTVSPALAAGEYNLARLAAGRPWDLGRGGTIVAAWSATPIRTRDFVRYGHWALSEIDRTEFRADPEAATLALATRLGASPAALSASVEYAGPALWETRSAYGRGQTYRGDTLDLAVKVWRNYARIQGICPSGTRDVTGAREVCSPPPPPGRAVRQVPVPVGEPYVPPRPQFSPQPTVSPAPAASISIPQPERKESQPVIPGKPL